MHGVVVTRLAVDQITAGAVVAAGSALLTGFLAFTAKKSDLKRCDMCGGQGNWQCVICAGTGKSVVEQGGTAYSSGLRVKQKCQACVGRGKRICRRCSGRGMYR